MRRPKSLRLRLAGSGFLSSVGGLPVLASMGFFSQTIVAHILPLHLASLMWASPCPVSQVPVMSCARAGARSRLDVRMMAAAWQRSLIMSLPGDRGGVFLPARYSGSTPRRQTLKLSVQPHDPGGILLPCNG